MIQCGGSVQQVLAVFQVLIRHLSFVRTLTRRWNSALLGVCVGVGLLALPTTGVTQEVKSVTVESQFMRFPGISIDSVDYNALRFEYAYQGQAEVLAVEARTESMVCAGQSVAKRYLSINYQGPEVIFRIVDTRRNQPLLLQQLDTSGSTDYGARGCDTLSDVAGDFDVHKQTWLAALTEEIMAGAREQMEQYVQDNVALGYESLMFPLFYVAADGSGYTEVNQAFDRARAAFDLNLEFGVTMEAHEQMAAAARVWESQLEQLLRQRKADPVSTEIRQALHRNLTAVYLFLGNFEQARRNDALAVARGMSAQDSLQELILTHERRYILSPKVAGNLVLMANLYRHGQNAVRDAQLVESDHFSNFKQALSQN